LDPNKALDFGFEVLKTADIVNPNRELVSTYNLIGQLLTNKKLYAEALSYFSEALKSYQLIPKSELKEKKIESPPWVLLNISNLYFAIDDIKNAKQKTLEAEKNFLLLDNERNKQIGLNTVYGNLGLFASLEKDYNLTEKLYLKTLESRKLIEDIDGEMYSYAQLVNLYLNTNNKFKANEYSSKAAILYEKINSSKNHESIYFHRNYSYVIHQFGERYFIENEFQIALDYFNRAKTLLKDFPDELPGVNSFISKCYLGLEDYNSAERIAIENLSKSSLGFNQKKENYRILESIYLNRNDYQNLIKVKDSLIKMGGLSGSLNIRSKFSNLETQILLTEKQSELNQNKITYNTYLYILIIGLVILFFSLVTIRINYNYQKERNTRLEFEQKLTKNQLDKKKLELVSKTNFIAQRNTSLDSLKQKIIKGKEVNDNEKITSKIEKEINKIIGSEKIFKNFESQFTEVYPNFFKTLILKYGKLSQNDLRLCAYIKMNQSTNQISQITGVSIRTVETQRYRLGKKLKLLKSENLNSVIMSI
jgi:tetratricopeptide (TPR) repeat protein